MSNGPDPIIRKLLEDRLSEFGDAERMALVQFSERSLAELHRPHDLGAELFHQAFYEVMSGSRQPRRENVESSKAFLNYLRGAVSSNINAFKRRWHREVLAEHPYETAADLTADPAKDAEISDAKTELFRLLRIRAPGRLIPTIDAWEKVFPGDIPAINGYRKYVFEVRQIAQPLFKELGWPT